MFRVDTYVIRAVASLAFALTTAPAAATTLDLSSVGANNFLSKLHERYCGDDAKLSANQKKCEEIEKKGMEDTSCKKTRADYDAGKTDFSSACGALGMSNEQPSEPRGVACSWTFQRCACMNKGFEDTDGKLRCEDFKTASSAEEKARDNLGLIDLERSREKMEACPDRMTDDDDRYQKQLDKANDRIDKAKEKMEKAGDKALDIDKNARKDQNEADKDMADKQKEYAEKLREIKRDKETKEGKLVQEMQNLRMEIDKISEQMRQIEVAMLDAQTKFNETIANIDLNCHASASTTVSKIQQERLVYERSRKLNRGNFNALLKNVGISDYDQWQKRAEVYYKRCLRSTPTRVSKRLAENAHKSAQRQAEMQLISLSRRKDRIEEQLRTFVSDQGCGAVQQVPGQAPTEGKFCQTLRSASEEMQEQQTIAQAGYYQAQQKKMGAMQDAANAKMKLGQDYAQAAGDLNNEKKRMENYRDYLDMKARRGSSGAKKDAEKLHSGHAKLETAARELVNSCCHGKMKNSGMCKEAGDFIKSIGGTLGETFDSLEAEPDSTLSSPSTTPPATDNGGARLMPMNSTGKANKGN